MTIRPLRPDEVGRLVTLWKEFMNDPSAMDELFPTHDENVKRETEFFNKLVAEDPKQILVAEEDGNLVGYLVFQKHTKTPLQPSHQWSYISDIYVRPSHRRHGIGRSLLRACLDELRVSGMTHLRLAVWLKNETAIRLYRDAGFEDYMLIMETEVREQGRTSGSRPAS